MPSHIYVQLGMWQQAVASNVEAYKAAVDLNARMKLAEGREDFHTLSWLGYANPMLGKFDEAKKNIEQAKAAADRNAGNAGIRDGYLGMRARLHLGNRPVGEALADGAGGAGRRRDHADMPGHAGAWAAAVRARPPGPTSSASAPRSWATWRRPRPRRRS